ncbi:MULTISPECIES: conjugative transposon protein TraK [Sphingobacterium]|uniref:conjugative transposon protein TraK n=1 Tax=Sphingobacterium TaxID=28453 RepID=UPI0008A44C59|nr:MULTISPECIES: conjugative transposon protein TraK [Sphingobacterium]MBB1642775.1 conjugative transposon protein TraK [Sphingobacterium sp. UME9]OFV19513.1 conjugal transfer protein [Sphingobacterium sp. HMSC13C05]
MFKQFSNIESAFRHVKLFTYVVVVASTILCAFTVYESYRMVRKAEERVYVLSNGKALEAIAGERKDNVAVEAKDHIKMFHHYFFTLDPDDKVIESNMSKALYLADGSAASQYRGLKENGYYNSIISGNVSQNVEADSIQIDFEQYPFRFRYFGKQKIIRPTAILSRILITEGTLRNVSRSDNNSHGFLVERWRIVDNRDIELQNR